MKTATKILDKIPRLKKNEYKEIIDQDFILKNGPQSNISFQNERYITTGEGYEACVYVYRYKKQVTEYWLSNLLNNDDTIAVLDIATKNQNEVKKAIDKSMDEHESRYRYSKSNTEKMDAENSYQEISQIYEEMEGLDKVMKMISCRIFVPGKTFEQADKNTEAIQVGLESAGFRGGIGLSEQLQDWRSMYIPYKEQQKGMYKRKGQPITSTTLAAGNPFHFSKLLDPRGSYYGTTETGGSVIFDYFYSTALRSSYNSVFIGNMGFGKSTTLKKIMKDRASRGDFVRVFDVANEYADLTEMLGGKIIRLDGHDGKIINALQILRSGESLPVAYNRHLQKVTTIYKYLSPTATANETKVLKSLLRQLYEEKGIIDPQEIEARDFTKLSPQKFPTWSDLLQLTRRELKTAFVAQKMEQTQDDMEDIHISTTKKLELLEDIEISLKDICESYGNLFDGVTSIDNIYDEQIVCFDIKSLKGMESTVFDALLFLGLSLSWDNCVHNGEPQLKAFNKGELEEEEIRNFLILMDEAHHIINANKLSGVELITLYCREARKYFGGIGLASQSIRDFVPDSADNQSIEEIKKLFELSTYKFILHQDANTKTKIKTVFQDEFTDSEVDSISSFAKGETILSMPGGNNITFQVEVSDDDLKLFGGGK